MAGTPTASVNRETRKLSFAVRHISVESHHNLRRMAVDMVGPNGDVYKYDLRVREDGIV
jgi:hypothetical protein